VDELRERLAAEQHEIWAHWMQYLFSVSITNPDGSYTIPQRTAYRWQRQMDTSYTLLTEKEKDSDREHADTTIKILQSLMEGVKLEIAP
jgi:hypothetical protein